MNEVPGIRLNKQKSTLEDPDEFEILISTLKKNENERTEEELEFMRQALSQIEYMGQLMNSLEIEVQMNLMRAISMKEMKKQEVVFYRGDPGTHFCMLLKGSLYVIKDHDKDTKIIDNLRSSPFQKKGDSTRSPKSSLNQQNQSGSPSKNTPAFEEVLKRENNPILSEDELFKAFPGHFLLNVLHAPNYFGEIALNEYLPRTATVVCREKCYIATMTRTKYKRILGEHIEQKNKEKTEFFRGIALLKDWPPQNISALLRNSAVVKFKHGQTIFKQGDEVNEVYFVKSGEIEMTKEKEIEIGDSKLVQRESETPKKINFQDRQLFKKFNQPWVNKLKKKEHFRVALVGSGEILGDLDLARNPRVRDLTAKCISQNAELYVIDRKLFLVNAKSTEELLHHLKYENPKKSWRTNFEQKLLEKKEAELTNVRNDDGKCHTYDPVEEMKRVFGLADENSPKSRTKRGKTISNKEPPPPFAKQLVLPDIKTDRSSVDKLESYRIFTKKSSLSDTSNRIGRFINLKNYREEKTKSPSDSIKENRFDGQFNFVTTPDHEKNKIKSPRSNVPRSPRNAKKIEMPSLKGIPTSSCDESNNQNSQSLHRSLKNHPFLTDRNASELSLFGKENSIASSLTLVDQLLSPQYDRKIKEFDSNDKTTRRLLHSLNIPELVRKQPFMIHKIMGNQTDRPTDNRRILTMKTEAPPAKGRAEIRGLSKELALKKLPPTIDTLKDLQNITSSNTDFLSEN